MKPTVGQRIVARLKEFTEALETGTVIADEFTCRTVTLDLEPSPYDPALVKKTRELLGVSQVFFAKFLGVSPQTVRAWEHGTNTPKDIACRFMDEIRRSPDHWRQRVRESTVSETVPPKQSKRTRRAAARKHAPPR